MVLVRGESSRPSSSYAIPHYRSRPAAGISRILPGRSHRHSGGVSGRSRRRLSAASLGMLIATVGILPFWLLSTSASWSAPDDPHHAVGPGTRGKDAPTNRNGPFWTTCDDKDLSRTGQEQQIHGDLCFLTCIFGESPGGVDQPADVSWFDRYWCHARFLLVTNLPDLPAPGWTRMVHPVNNATQGQSTPSQEDFIVASRHAKFLAWEALPDLVPQTCAAVVYLDGYLTPVRYTSWRDRLAALVTAWPWSPASPLFVGTTAWGSPPRQRVPPPPKFQAVLGQTRTHPWGLSQVKQRYFDGLPMATLLRNLVRDRKDTEEHVERTLDWFRSRDDFRDVLPYYLNKYFAYDPNNSRYRELSSFFWETYTSYGGLWRDQPLWAYALHHFNVTPAVMTTEGTITKGGDLFRTGGTLGWGKHVYT